MGLSFDQRRAILVDAWQAGLMGPAAVMKALANIDRIERAAEREKVGK